MDYYSDDDLHMNRAGYRVLGRSIAEYLACLEEQAGDLRIAAATAPPAWMERSCAEDRPAAPGSTR